MRLFYPLAIVALIVAAGWVVLEAVARLLEHAMAKVEERLKARRADELRAVSAHLRELNGGVDELQAEVEALGGAVLRHNGDWPCVSRVHEE